MDPWLRMRLAPAHTDRAGVGGATVRDALHAIASVRPDPAMLTLELGPVRALLDCERERLRQRLRAGEPGAEVARRAARLLDGTVVGLCHLGRIFGPRPIDMVPPLAVIARGGYGRRMLASGANAELLFLVATDPIRCRQGVALAQFVAQALADLGWQASGVRRTVRGCLCEAHLEPAIGSDFGEGRLIWGCHGLLARLRAELRQAMPPENTVSTLASPFRVGSALAA